MTAPFLAEPLSYQDVITRCVTGGAWILVLVPSAQTQQQVLLDVMQAFHDYRSRSPRVVAVGMEMVDGMTEYELGRSNIKVVYPSDPMFPAIYAHQLIDDAAADTPDIVMTPMISGARDVGACMEAVLTGRTVISRIVATQPSDALWLIRECVSELPDDSPYRWLADYRHARHVPVYVVRDGAGSLESWRGVTRTPVALHPLVQETSDVLPRARVGG